MDGELASVALGGDFGEVADVEQLLLSLIGLEPLRENFCILGVALQHLPQLGKEY